MQPSNQQNLIMKKRKKMMIQRRIKRLVTAAAVAVVAVGAVNRLLAQQSPIMIKNKTANWEFIMGDDGTDLRRTELPNGWLVESENGFLVVIEDKDKNWLKD